MNATTHGRIFTPDPGHWAQCPVVDDLGDRWRIYFADRDNGRSFITYIEVEADNPANILYNHMAAICKPGFIGDFDEHGMMPSSIVKVGDEKYLYYTGWKCSPEEKYENSIGCLRVKGNWFKRMFIEPVLKKGDGEEFVAHLNVFPSLYGGFFGLYSSCYEWKDGEPVYDSKLVVSLDGLNWTKRGSAIELSAFEGGICGQNFFRDSPYDTKGLIIYGVRDENDYRGGAGSYRIEYGISIGSMFDKRGALPGLVRSDWDSHMQCYPYLFTSPKTGIKYLFYNGNEFGKTGIGFATIQS